MDKYILSALLDIEKELVVGNEKGQDPKTLEKIRELSKSIAIKINRDEEKQMIENVINAAI
jgi:hypothetical protein